MQCETIDCPCVFNPKFHDRGIDSETLKDARTRRKLYEHGFIVKQNLKGKPK